MPQPDDVDRQKNVEDRVVTDAGRTIGRAPADLVNCLNPATIVLGG